MGDQVAMVITVRKNPPLSKQRDTIIHASVGKHRRYQFISTLNL